MNPTAPRPPRALQLAACSFHWLQRPDRHLEGGVLLINEKPYLVSAVRADKPRLVKDRPVIAYRLTKAGGQVHDLHPAPGCWQCDCGDFTFHRPSAPTAELRACKHVRAVLAALPVAGLPVPQPIEPTDPLSDAPTDDAFAFTNDDLDCP